MADNTTAGRPATCLYAGEPFVGRRGLTYALAISAKSARASAIHMQFLTMPLGARAKINGQELVAGGFAQYYT